MSSSGACLSRLRRLLALLSLLPFLSTGCTMAVHADVRDQSGRPVKDAVVYATAREPRPSPPRGAGAATMVVENLEFKPPVLPVLIGTGVSFLNRDDIGHQIYSISAAKNFEVPADRRSSSAEVVFDKRGAVVLGCALHDRMIGHVYVLTTPHFAATGPDGKAALEGLPRGAYEVRVWHPDMMSPAAVPARRVADSPSHRAGVDFAITVQRAHPPPRRPASAAPPAMRRDER